MKLGGEGGYRKGDMTRKSINGGRERKDGHTHARTRTHGRARPHTQHNVTMSMYLLTHGQVERDN